VLGIEVTDLREHTFFATVHVRDAHGRESKVDARPSDAIALALRAGCPIRVQQKVIDKARRIDLRVDGLGPDLRRDARGEAGESVPDAARAAELLESLGESAFGKWKM
jgi:hypothetical protein